MLQAPIVVEQFYWADQPRGGQDRAMQEIFLSDADHSLARYWQECTFGLVDLQTGGVVTPIQSIGLTHDTYYDPNGDLQSHRTRDETIARAIATLPGYLPNPGPKIVFMFDNPSPAGAGGSTLGSYAVLDFAGSHSYMAHEVGHTLGFEHSYGFGVVYGDPYCVTSALTFGGSDPTHPRLRPVDSAVPLTVFPSDMRFWDRFGPMPSAASVYRTLPEFASSSYVRKVNFDETVTVRALSEAGAGDVALLVLELDGRQWMAELRVATNWDAGLGGTDGPGEALVLHGLLPVGGDAAQIRVDYQGRIAVGSIPITSPVDVLPAYRLPNGAQPDVRLVLESFDPVSSTARVKFTHRARPVIRAAERLGPASVIQANLGAGLHRNFEACILDGDELWHWWRDNSVPWQPWNRGQQIATGAAYPGTIIQSNFGSGDYGNFEVVVPIRTDSGRIRLRHYAHDNSIAASPWLAGAWITAPEDDVAGSAALIQSDYGNPDEHGNFEVVVALRQPGGLSRLRHYWRDHNTDGFPWRQANWVTPADQVIVGSPSLIQSDFQTGGHGHFEVVVPIMTPVDQVGLRHFWGDLSQGTLDWFPQQAAPEDLLRGFYNVVGSPSLIQSDFGSTGHGNLELVVPVRLPNGTTQLRHVWIDKAGPNPHVWNFGQYITESCRGTATLFRSSYGNHDHRNFDVVVQEDRGALAHYWHPNDNVNYPWVRAASFDALDDVPRIEPPAERIAQLTGEHDRAGWDGTPPPPYALNRTEHHARIVGTDLGVSFEHGGRTYVLFGDTWRVPFDGETDNLDAIAAIDGVAPNGGFVLSFFPQPPLVPGISQAGFEVPIDGVSWNGAMYVFFSTDHYQAQGRDLMGRTVLARSDDDGRTFTLLYSLPTEHFINVSASIVEDGAAHGLDAGPQLVLFGSGRYRSSDVYLAVKPAQDIANKDGWQYFAGLSGWSGQDKQAAPLFPAGNVGELSVRWSADAQHWLAFWNENDGSAPHRIMLRAGVRPHGPWDDPAVVFRLEDGLGEFIHQPGQDHTAHVFGDADKVWGDVYGPYQFAKYTHREGTVVQVYFSMSVWNPYQSMQMRTDLPLRRFADSLRSASHQFAAVGDAANAAIYGGRADTVLSILYSAGLAEAEGLAASAEHHHVTGYQLIWGGHPDAGNIELAKQREEALSAAEIAEPMVAGLPDPALGSLDVVRLGALFRRLIGFSTHGSPDMSPGVRAADFAVRAYQQADGDHRVDVVQVWTDLAQRHHETGYGFGHWAGNPDLGNLELARQREAARSATEIAEPMVASLPNAAVNPQDVLRLAALLWRLIGLSTHGSSDMSPGVRAADFAVRAYQHAEGDHRVDVVQVWTDLAQRHHETGYWFGHWAGNPELGESELRKQRRAAAVGGWLANEVVAELPELTLDREKLTQLLGLLNRLAGTPAAPGMVTHGAAADDPELPALEGLAEATRRSGEKVSALLASMPG
jgi:hypothetical protein